MTLGHMTTNLIFLENDDICMINIGGKPMTSKQNLFRLEKLRQLLTNQNIIIAYEQQTVNNA
jgi:hypothetical protein